MTSKRMERESEVFTVNHLRTATGLAIAVFAIFTIALAAVPATALAAGAHGGGHGGFHGGPRGHGHPGFHGHRGFHGHSGFRFRFGPVLPYPYSYYPYGYAAPAYWYYCPSYRAYYPSVTTCPEAWVPVPSS